MAPFRHPHELKLEGIANFRDLGGHTARDGRRLRSGHFFRSGHLAHASDDDVGSLGRLGIRRVFDFRTEADIEKDGADRLPEGTTHLRLPMPDPAAAHDIRAMVQTQDARLIEETFGDGKGHLMMVEAAAALVRERREAYGMFIAELARSESIPALVHCSAGKDRAGWACSVVLLAIGIPEEQVVEQYLLSNRETEAIRERLATSDGVRWVELLSPLLAVREEYIEASFRAVRDEWGSFDGYLQEGLGISESQREALRERLLE